MPWRSATTLCWWIVSRFSWRAETKLRAVELRELAHDAGDHLAHAVLDEARTAVRLFDDLDLVRALHQLVDLRGHARLGDLQQRGGVDLLDALLDAADLQRRQPALVVRGDGNALEDPLDLPLGEAVGGEPLARAAGDELLRARACGHAGRRHADGAARAVLEGHGAAVQRVDLLRLHARHRRRLVLGVARRDRHLGALGALARAHELGDVLGERLGAERRLAEHDLADRLVDDLLEARHVRALLLAAEIDEALQAREEQLVADADDLLDARHADAREPDGDARGARLDVLAGAVGDGGADRLHVRQPSAGARARPAVEPAARTLGPCQHAPHCAHPRGVTVGPLDRRFWYQSALGQTDDLEGESQGDHGGPG